MEPNTRDESETYQCNEWQWNWDFNCYSRVNSAGQTEFSDGQHDEITSAAEPTSTVTEHKYTHEYPSNSRYFPNSSIAINAPTTVEDGLLYNSTQYGNQSFLPRNENAQLDCLDDEFYTENPQTGPEASAGDSGYGWTPISTEPTPPAEQEVPESRTIRATSRMTELSDRSFSVRKTSFFEIGRVFGIAWFTTSSKRSSSEDSFFDREPSFTSGRMSYRIFRFVVVEVRRDEGHCVCLPIASEYRLSQREDHLHELGFMCKSPSMLPTVEGINLPHVRISSREIFSDPCLMHYSRIYIIECKVKVKEIGIISPSSVECLCHNFLLANPQAQEAGGALYFRPSKRKEEYSKEEDKAREREAERMALYFRAQRISELNTDNRSEGQNVTNEERSSHRATGVSNFSSRTPVRASTSSSDSSPSYTYRNAPNVTMVPVSRASGRRSKGGAIDGRAKAAAGMEQKGRANAPKAVDSTQLVTSPKIANQAGNVDKGKQKATQPVFQLTPASLVAPQVTRDNASI